MKLGSLLAPSAFSIKMTVSDAGIAGAAAGIQYPDFGAHLVRSANALRHEYVLKRKFVWELADEVEAASADTYKQIG